MTLEVGQLLDERYQVERLLGSGGLADVYLVRHVALGSRHALKVLTWDRPSLDRRLLLEGRIQAQLRHPNIVAVTDVTRVDGRAALLMEFVDGPTLDQLIEREAPGVDALDLFAGILAAVVLAHDAGVLHRDLKPQNILIAEVGGQRVPKVTDFGLAKLVADEMAAGATRTNVTMGTPGYMAPEQIRDAGAVDARTDVFALGALLHEMITGRPAFADENGQISLTATIEQSAPPLPDSVPAHVRAAITDALSPDLHRRPANARDLAERLYPPGDPRRPSVLVLSSTPMALEAREGPVPTWSTRVPNAATIIPAAAPSRAAPIAVGALAAIGLTLGIGLAWALWPQPPIAVPEPAVTVAPAPIQAPAPSPPPNEAAPVEVAAAEVQSVEGSPAEVTPAPVPRPEPTAADPEPTPAEPDPVIAVDPDPPAPAITPEPVRADPPPPSPTPQAAAVSLVGTWTGIAQGRPLELRIRQGKGDAVTADLVFPSPAPRVTPLSGRAVGGALTLTANDGTLTLEAAVVGGALRGTYGNQRRSVPFELSR